VGAAGAVVPGAGVCVGAAGAGVNAI
jgi:hypothetical protein